MAAITVLPSDKNQSAPSSSAEPNYLMSIQTELLSEQDVLTLRPAVEPSRELAVIRHNWAFRILRSPAMVWLDLFLLLFTLLQVGIGATMLRHGMRLQVLLEQSIPARDLVLLATCLIGWSPVFWASGLYRQFNFRQLAPRIPLAVGLCSIVLLVACRVWTPGVPVNGPIVLFFFASCVALCLPRVSIMLWSRMKRGETRNRNVVLIGSGNLAQQLAWKLRHQSQNRPRILGFVDSNPQPGHFNGIGGHLGGLEDLEALLMTNVIDEVHIALPFKSHYTEIQEAVRLCESAGIEPHYMAELFPTQVTKKVQAKEGRVVLRMTHSDSRLLLKRMMDFAVSLTGILLISPVLIVIAILVRFSGPGPIIFRQTRYGVNKRPFTMYKFRSMVSDAELQQANLEHRNEASGPVFKITRDPRITPIGVFLRKTSLDELPQLFNVLFGQMSLVGPRPLNLRDVRRFSELHLMRRFSVTPGMTGLWQVSGRSDLGFGEWIELDLKYIDDWSLKLDLKILARTLPAVLKGRGAS